MPNPTQEAKATGLVAGVGFGGEAWAAFEPS